MHRITFVLLLLVLAVITVAPPGLCPCWLLPDVANNHPHPGGMPLQPHPHDYLRDLFQSQSAATGPISFVPAVALILLMAISGRWFTTGGMMASGFDWRPRVNAPPPRRWVLPFAVAAS